MLWSNLWCMVVQSYRAEIIVNLLLNQSSVAHVCAQCQHNQGFNYWQQKNKVNNWTTNYTFPVRHSRSERTCLWRKPDKTPPQPQHINPAAVWQKIQMFPVLYNQTTEQYSSPGWRFRIHPSHLICCLNFSFARSLFIYWDLKFIAQESWSCFFNIKFFWSYID